jgi:hypothetical protein
LTTAGTQIQEEVYEFKTWWKARVTIRKTEEFILKNAEKYITKIRIALSIQWPIFPERDCYNNS